MSSETGTLPTQPGSVSYVVSHLLTWIKHRRPGIVWVEFWSDEVRDQAIEQIDATCRAAQISFQRIEAEAASNRRDWERVRDRVESTVGVVNILFPALFSQDSLDAANFRDFAIAMNLDRERIFSANATQIWWVARPFSAIIRPFAPDFLSWVHARFTLSELPPSMAEHSSNLELIMPPDREPEAGRAALRQSSPEAPVRAALADSRLLKLPEILQQSEDLLTAGKLKEALALAGEAVYGFRQTLSIGEEPQSGLAASLDLLGRIQSRLGQRQQALASSAEAVRRYRALAEANPDAFLPNLAASLNNQATMQSDVGQRAEALVCIAEAVRHYRALAESDPDTFLPDLARSLNNLANMQSEMGQRAEALASIAEAVGHYRALAEANPDAYLADLAMSLNNLANRQSDMGQRAEALASIVEAVRLRRALAEANPDAFLPDLATLLNNQANMQSAMGQRMDALASIGEAVGHYRALADANPDAFLPDLAMSLTNQAKMQSDTGQRAEALASIAEAVRLRRALVNANPDAFLPDLAGSLNNQATMQSDMGQRAEALASSAEAVRLYSTLAKANPDAFLPDLARALSVHGDCLAALGRPSEAREAAREALVHLAPSFGEYPAVFADLAKATLQDYLLRTAALGEEPDQQLLAPYADLLKTEIQNAHDNPQPTPVPKHENISAPTKSIT